MVNDKIALSLTLAQTMDLDAHICMDQEIKKEFKQILSKYGLLYDENSYLIWVPNDSYFVKVFDFSNVLVKAIDPESALVSKAVKAPQKNRQLIQDAIATGKFATLVEQIKTHGGKVEYFAED